MKSAYAEIRVNGRSVGEAIEEIVCYGSSESTPALTTSDRQEIIDFATSFEECHLSRAEIEGLADKDVLNTAYWVMADYARGQM